MLRYVIYPMLNKQEILLSVRNLKYLKKLVLTIFSTRLISETVSDQNTKLT